MEAAMRDAQDKYEFRVSWLPYLLRPNMPPEGIPKEGNRVSAHLKQAGESVGIDFTGKTPVYPYTLPAHVVLDMAKDNESLQNDLAERLFKAYFTDGCALDPASLADIAESAGMNRTEVAAAVVDQNSLAAVARDAAQWSNKGISGVPYFMMNGQKTFSGAQDSATFSRMFEISTEKFPVNDETKASA